MYRRRQRQPSVVSDALDQLRRVEPVVHLVANGVRGDSRVIKSARASMDEGLPTLVIGISSDEDFHVFEAEDVPVLLVPFGSAEPPASRGSRTILPREWKRWEREIHRWRLRRAARTRHPRRIAGALRRAAPRRTAKIWADARPNWLQINSAFADALDRVRPRFVHIHDAIPLPGAVAYAASAHNGRFPVTTLYDAHECCPRLLESFPQSPVYRAMAAFEAEHIRDVSHIITVSDQIAGLIAKFYGLASTPAVVTNCPSSRRDRDAPSLRREVGLTEDAQLAVYAGWVAPERGLDTILRAMPSLPDLHLALVVNSQTKDLLEALKLARRLDVLERVHTAPYVLPSQVTEYLSSADLGLIPRKAGRHLDLSLPTKFREYAHAGLPLVVSNNAAMAAEIRRTGIGRVFKAGNVGGLALQVGRVLESPERYRRMITPQLLDEYSWERQTAVLRPYYASVRRSTDAASSDAIRGALSPLLTHELSTAENESPTESWRNSSARLYGVKLGIGRANSAGQASSWAEAVTEHFGVSAQSFAPVRPITRRPHVATRRTYNVPQGAAELGRVASEYTYLLIDGYTSLFGQLTLDDLERDIELLRPHLFGIALVAHGSEIRDPDAHMRAVEGSYFSQANSEWVDLFRGITARNRAIADRFDGPLFVSTPDLLSDLPSASWLPVVVDRDSWSDTPDATFGKRLRVLHQPSRSDPPIKGTDVIDPVLRRLDEEGVLQYVRVDGVVDAEDMPALVAESDVVVDQIRTGSYGVAAAEAMAAGRVVVGALSTRVRGLVAEDIPIIDGPPARFEQVVRQLAQSERSDLRSIAERGRVYAADWHDGRRAANVLMEKFLDVEPC